MNTYVAILILKLEENQYFQHIMLYYFKKGKNTPEMQKKRIHAVYGEGAATDWTCQKWFVKFHAGDFFLDHSLWLGRPVEVDSDQIETLIQDNQCYTTWEIADIVKIPK